MLRALAVLASLGGCMFDDNRTEAVCRAPEECAAGESCVNHFCVVRDAAPPEMAVAPPDIAVPPGDASTLAPDTGVAGCPSGASCLLPTHDTYVDQARPETSHGISQQLVVAIEPTGERVVHIKFDIAALAAAPTSAELSVFLRRVDPPGEARVARLHLVDVFWDEDVTWNSRPRIAAEDVLQAPVTAGVGARQAFDVTEILQRAVADGRSQVAFALQAEADAGPVVWAFVSREGGNAPWLVLRGGSG